MAISSNLFRSSQISALSQLRPRGAQAAAPAAPEPADPEVSMRRGTVGHLVNSELADLEAQAQAAGAVGDVDTVRHLADQMGQLIEGNRKQLSKMASYQGANEGQLAVAQRAGHYLYGDYLHGATDKGRITTKGLAHMMNPDSTEAREFAGYKARTNAISAKLADVRKYGGEYGNAMADSMTLDPMFIQASRGKGAFDPAEINMLHDAVMAAQKKGGDPETYHVAAKAFRSRFAKDDVAMSAPGAYLDYLTCLEGLVGGPLTSSNLGNALARYGAAYTGYANPGGNASHNAAQKVGLTPNNALTAYATHADTTLLHRVLNQATSLADELGISAGERGSYLEYVASPQVYDGLRWLSANGVLTAMATGSTEDALIREYIKTQATRRGMSIFAGTEAYPGDALTGATEFYGQVQKLFATDAILGKSGLNTEVVAALEKAGKPIDDATRVDRVVETYYLPIADAVESGVYRAAAGFMSRQGGNFRFEGRDAATLTAFFDDPTVSKELKYHLTSIGFDDKTAGTFIKALKDTATENPGAPLDITAVMRRMTTTKAAATVNMDYVNFLDTYDRVTYTSATSEQRGILLNGVAKSVYGWENGEDLKAIKVPTADGKGTVNGAEALDDLLTQVGYLGGTVRAGHEKEAEVNAVRAVAAARRAKAEHDAKQQDLAKAKQDPYGETPAEVTAEPFSLGSLDSYLQGTLGQGQINTTDNLPEGAKGSGQTKTNLPEILRAFNESRDPAKVRLAKQAEDQFFQAVRGGDTAPLVRTLTSILAVNRAESEPTSNEVLADRNKKATLRSADIGAAWLRSTGPNKISSDEWAELDGILKDMRSHIAAPLTTLEKTSYLAAIDPMVGGPLGGMTVLLDHYMMVDPGKTARAYNLIAKIIGADDLQTQAVTYGSMTENLFAGIAQGTGDIIAKYNDDPYGAAGNTFGVLENLASPLGVLSSGIGSRKSRYFGRLGRGRKFVRTFHPTATLGSGAGGLYNYADSHWSPKEKAAKTRQPVGQMGDDQIARHLLPGGARTELMYDDHFTGSDYGNMVLSSGGAGALRAVNSSKGKRLKKGVITAVATAGLTALFGVLEGVANSRKKDEAYGAMVDNIVAQVDAYAKAVNALSASGVRSNIGINDSALGYAAQIKDIANSNEEPETKLKNIGRILAVMESDIQGNLPYSSTGNTIMEAARSRMANPTTPEGDAIADIATGSSPSMMYEQGLIDRSFVDSTGLAENLTEAQNNLKLFQRLAVGNDRKLSSEQVLRATNQILPSTSVAGNNTELRTTVLKEASKFVSDALAYNPNLTYEDIRDFVAKYAAATAEEIRAQTQSAREYAQKEKQRAVFEFKVQLEKIRHANRTALEDKKNKDRRDLMEFQQELKGQY